MFASDELSLLENRLVHFAGMVEPRVYFDYRRHEIVIAERTGSLSRVPMSHLYRLKVLSAEAADAIIAVSGVEFLVDEASQAAKRGVML